MKKAESFQICAECPGAWKASCWIYDIEDSQEDVDIQPPQFPASTVKRKAPPIDEKTPEGYQQGHGPRKSKHE